MDESTVVLGDDELLLLLQLVDIISIIFSGGRVTVDKTSCLVGVLYGGLVNKLLTLLRVLPVNYCGLSWSGL